MKRLRLRHYRRAEQDATAQVAYYVDQGKVRTAERFIDALEKAFQRLSQMPELGTLGEFQNPRLGGIRVWPVPRFEKILIFYRPTDETLDIIRVLHSSRDITGILEEEV